VKVGDIVKHKVYGYVALVMRLPSNPFDGVTVETAKWGVGRWNRNNCEVISESR